MNRKLKYFSIASLLLVWTTTSYCQAAKDPAPKDTAKEEKLPTADELSEKCAKGSGGKEAWAKLKTMVLTGTVDIPTFNATGTIEVYAKRPNKSLRVTALSNGQFVEKEGFDGQAAWRFDSQNGLKTLVGKELDQARFESVFDTDVRLKELYPDMKVTGRAKVGDHDAFAVVAHEPGGKTVTMYLDAQTGVRVAEDSEGPDESGNVVKTKLLFEDYRSGGGIHIPYRIRISAPNVSVVIQIQDVKFNDPVDDAKFAIPAANADSAQPR